MPPVWVQAVDVTFWIGSVAPNLRLTSCEPASLTVSRQASQRCDHNHPNFPHVVSAPCGPSDVGQRFRRFLCTHSIGASHSRT